LDGWTLEAVEHEVREGRAQFWPLERSAAVTQIHTYPAGKVLRVWLAGGRWGELEQYLTTADAYAREQGCYAVEVEGRPGWERLLHGYAKRRVVLVKELN
jgi:hypothetical protein